MNRLLLLLCVFAVLDPSPCPAAPIFHPLPALEPGGHLLFVLQMDRLNRVLLDGTGQFKPIVKGGTVMDDPEWGPCLRFGDGDGNGLTVPDEGKLSFEDGLLLEAWIYLEEPPPAKTTPIALKAGSFSWELAKGKLNTSWLVFPSQPIFTTTPAQFKYFPVGGDTINGFMQIPVRKWVRLTMAYDEPIGVVTTRIDGMPDRQRYRYRGPERLQTDGHSPLELLQGFKNCRLFAVRLSRGRPHLNPPSLEAYVQPLPYQDHLLVTLDHIDPALPLPIEVTVVGEKASGEAATLQKFSLDSRTKNDVLLDLPTWKNSLHTITVNATAEGRSIYSKNFRIANVKPAGPIRIEVDRTLSKDGKKFFPLMVYHAMPEDFPLLAELGFNVLLNNFNLRQHTGTDPAAYSARLRESLDAAEKNHLLLWVAANSDYNQLFTIPVAKAHPALLGWYGADEPWGDLSRLVESYNTLKMLAPDQPVLIIQNNYSRLQETALGADIIGTDPYPIPNVSLRHVVDATEAAVRAVSGRKPVWTILPQYLGKIPTREELRCMVWLAIISGADGVGLFDWDERLKDRETGVLSGWHTTEHSEQVENVRVVLKELHALEPLLLSPKAAKQPRLLRANAAVHALTKETEGKRYLLLASDSRREEEDTVMLEGWGDGEARPLTEGTAPAKLRLEQGALPIKLPPLGVAIYELVVP